MRGGGSRGGYGAASQTSLESRQTSSRKRGTVPTVVAAGTMDRKRAQQAIQQDSQPTSYKPGRQQHDNPGCGSGGSTYNGHGP